MRIQHTLRSSLPVAVLALGLIAGAAVAQSGTSSYPPATSSTATTPTSTPTSSSSSSDMNGSTSTVSGKVISSSPTSLVVQTDAGTRLTLVVDSVTTQPAALAMGNQVTVRYTAVGGAYHADSVALAPGTMTSDGSASNAGTATTSSAYDNGANATTPSTSMAPRNGRLPKTASHLPLVLVLGAAAAALGYGLHIARSQS